MKVNMTVMVKPINKFCLDSCEEIEVFRDVPAHYVAAFAGRKLVPALDAWHNTKFCLYYDALAENKIDPEALTGEVLGDGGTYYVGADNLVEITQMGDMQPKFIQCPSDQGRTGGAEGSVGGGGIGLPGQYIIKDSGSKSQYEDGMQRDNTAGNPRFDLMYPKNIPYEEQLLTRVAMQYSVGGEKYGDRNWERSSSEESLAHHEAALMRHVVKFLTGVEDGEDHAAAIVWNVNAVDLTRRNIATSKVGWLEAAKEDFRKEVREVLDVPDWATSPVAAGVQDLVFEDGDNLSDSTQDLWTYDSHEGWFEFIDAEGYSLTETDLTKVAADYGPLTVMSGPSRGCTIGKNGTVYSPRNAA